MSAMGGWWGMPTYIVTVPLEDRPGELAKAARTLGNALVNITAFTVDHGQARFLTSDPQRALAVLNGKGFDADAHEVAEIQLENRRGELARVCEALADADINIRHAMGLAHHGAGTVYIDCDDIRRAAPILSNLGIGKLVVHTGLGRI
jgi:hypothetical protein